MNTQDERTKEHRPRRSSHAKKERSHDSSVGIRIIPLGGMGEIGKNITAIECDGDILVIDCGLKFPDDEMLGIDYVIPDVEYLVQNKDSIRAVVLTHGHEDHIGGLPQILPRLDAPIYGTPLTLALVENKIYDAKVSYRPKYRKVSAGHSVTIGCFQIDFIKVSHSIPDAVALCIRTPYGNILHSGDFKIDTTPMHGDSTDLAALADIGKEGVLLLLSDSTNSERPGFTPSESSVAKTFDDLFRANKDRRIVIASFASNIYRAQIVLNTAARFNRKVILNGRSMVANVELAKKLGYIDYSDDITLTPEEADRLPESQMNKVVVLTTGSQGEPFSGLVIMSKGSHKQIKLGSKDTVIISATPIPGNEKLVSNTVNRLFSLGCDVVYEKSAAIHVSGHASREEQKLLLSLTKPKYFVPCHGEYRHLVRHSQLAREMGINAKNIFILQNGDSLDISKGGAAKLGTPVKAGSILVDIMMKGELDGNILRQRRELSESGLLAIAVTLSESFDIIGRPVFDTRGFGFGQNSESLSFDIERAIERAVGSLRLGVITVDSLPTEIRKRTREVIGRHFRIYPSIMPLINFASDDQQGGAKP